MSVAFGAVYTRPWTANLILDLAGYLVEENLVDAVAVEPSAGDGAFLIPMVERLVSSCRRQKSSGEKQRMGRISKHGSRLLRFLLVEAANSSVRSDEVLRKLYQRLVHRRDLARAKVAVARHLLIRAFIMMRDEIDYSEFLRRGVAVRSARTVHRPKVPDTLIERPASGQ